MLNSFANAAKIKAAQEKTQIADSSPYREYQSIIKHQRETKPVLFQS